LACIALALTFLQAPFMHVHEHEHSGPIFHAHYRHIQDLNKAPQFRDFDPDDDAHDQSWFSTIVNHLAVQLAVPQQVFCFMPPIESELFPAAQIKTGHDPPKLTQSSPRSPPNA
jgi:hypothetical protein